MIKMITIALLPFLLFAETSLWKVSKGPNHIYLGGTIHLLRPTDFPLPPEFDKAYDESQVIAFETDLAEMNTPDFQSRLIAAVTYPMGKSLKQDLTKETYINLTNFLMTKGVPISAVNQFRPSMVSILITQWEMAKFQMAEEGVDLYFYKKATAQKKRTIGLETTDQQISYIASLGSEDPDGLLRNTIDEISTLEGIISTLISSWRTGDEEQLYNLISKEMKEKYPSVYKSLLIDRNYNWKPAIMTMLNSQPTELILVGAGHLVGSDGLLDILKNEGCTIEQATFTGVAK